MNAVKAVKRIRINSSKDNKKDSYNESSNGHCHALTHAIFGKQILPKSFVKRERNNSHFKTFHY